MLENTTDSSTEYSKPKHCMLLGLWQCSGWQAGLISFCFLLQTLLTASWFSRPKSQRRSTFMEYLWHPLKKGSQMTWGGMAYNDPTAATLNQPAALVQNVFSINMLEMQLPFLVQYNPISNVIVWTCFMWQIRHKDNRRALPLFIILTDKNLFSY